MRMDHSHSLPVICYYLFFVTSHFLTRKCLLAEYIKHAIQHWGIKWCNVSVAVYLLSELGVNEKKKKNDEPHASIFVWLLLLFFQTSIFHSSFSIILKIIWKPTNVFNYHLLMYSLVGTQAGNPAAKHASSKNKLLIKKIEYTEGTI